MILTSKLGETKTFRIPLRRGNKPFEPGDEYGLVFTVKSAPDTQEDADRLFQKYTPPDVMGITVEASEAIVSVLRFDTYHDADAENDPPIIELHTTPGTYYWDIRATGLEGSDFEGDSFIANEGVYKISRATTRDTEPTGPIFSTEEPVFQGPTGPSAYDSYVATTEDDPVLTEEQWVTSLKGEDGEDGDGVNNTTIGPDAPTNPQQGDVWIDTDGWIESHWQTDLGEEYPGGYWVSKDAEPSSIGYLTYGTYFLQWTETEGGTPYNLIWTPTT